MPFSFEILKPRDIKSALLSTEQKIISKGWMFSGDEKSGRFSGKGIAGNYSVGNSAIKITITKKPLMYPASAVRSAIEDYFRQ